MSFNNILLKSIATPFDIMLTFKKGVIEENKQ